jgi:hypothetical protein
MAKMDHLRPLFRFPAMRNLLKRGIKLKPNAGKRERTMTHSVGRS